MTSVDYVVTVMVNTKYSYFAEEPLAFIFSSDNEAKQFAEHVRDYYKFEVFGPIMQGVDTYYSAIQSLIDAIGPSPDE